MKKNTLPNLLFIDNTPLMVTYKTLKQMDGISKAHLCILVMLFLMLSVPVFAQSVWTQNNNFGGSARSGAIAFSISEKGYVAAGGSIIEEGKELWEYDHASDSWSQKADIGGEYGRQFAVGFSIGDYGYVGTGNGIDPLNDFWQYDPALNSWTKKKKFPGDKRWHASGFSIGDKGYIGSGAGPQGDYKEDYYEYDPATDSWTQIADMPGASRIAATGFTIGNKGYVAFGTKGSAGATSDLWEYDPATGNWTQKSSCPGTPRNWAVGFVIGDKAYAGTGIDDDFNYLNDFWKYDPATDSWSAVDSIPASGRSQAVGFAIGDKGYVGLGGFGPFQLFKDFWEFTPSGCDTPANLNTVNITGMSARLKWSAAVSATKYIVQYRADAPGSTWMRKTINAGHTSVVLNNLNPGTAYKWKVKTVCGNLVSEYSAAQTFSTQMRLQPELSSHDSPLSVYPNPFSASGVLSFSVAENTATTIEVFDLTVRKTTVLLNEMLDAGEHQIMLTREQFGEGIYLVRLIAGNQSKVIKVMVQ